MKKLLIIIAILSSLIIANILVKTENSELDKDIKTFSEEINLLELASSFEIFKKDNKIKLTKKSSCYKIKSIDYCADSKKVQLLKKFLSGNVKDIYENREENLMRLGFDNVENKSTMIINGNKTLFFGNINQYNEIYVLQEDNIYKVDYYKGILETTTKQWIDKSKPIINTVENDKFNILIHKKAKLKPCSNISHKDLITDKKFSTLRNTFFDLYASDVKATPNEYYVNVVKNDSLFTIYLESSNSKKNLNHFMIWKEDHLVYFAESVSDKLPKFAFVVPNSVYDNISIFCKK
ncbi:DUF4340 domain-containing protein [Gammaproteobacteria bacterium]|nr:DUF4340 domain-containing protein [Gammaproteobacteria bacterium]